MEMIDKIDQSLGYYVHSHMIFPLKLVSATAKALIDENGCIKSRLYVFSSFFPKRRYYLPL